MRKTLGVIGGMGPAATLDFLAKLQGSTLADKDEDHIRVVMDLNPRVPSRHFESDAATIELAEMAVRLRDAGAEILAMPCNTAHVAREAIEQASELFLVDMLDEAVNEAAEVGGERVGMLSTSLSRGLYIERMRIAGLQPVSLSPLAQEALMEAIFRVKAGDFSEDVNQVMVAAAAELVREGADAIIAGCTEVPLVLDESQVAVPLIDATEALARACVRECLG